jgi:hypothetical protein
MKTDNNNNCQDIVSDIVNDVPKNAININVIKDLNIENDVKVIKDLNIENDFKVIKDLNIENDFKVIIDLNVENDLKVIKDLNIENDFKAKKDVDCNVLNDSDVLINETLNGLDQEDPRVIEAVLQRLIRSPYKTTPYNFSE